VGEEGDDATLAPYEKGYLSVADPPNGSSINPLY